MKQTPMMQQYSEIKSRHEGFLLFYRMGDFYELFGEDAIIAAEALSITLTQRRSSKEQDGIPMCGVPFHAAEGYIAKLLEYGYKVALCEQIETPEEAKQRGGYKALVKRDVVRLYTGGTLTEDSMLPEKTHNYLAAVHTLGGDMSLGWLDLSSGEFAVTTVSPKTLNAELARLNPKEILVDEKIAENTPELQNWQHLFSHPFTNLFESRTAENTLKAHLGVSTLDGFGFEGRAQSTVCGALVGYLEQTQKSTTSALLPPRVMVGNSHMHLDPATRTNLELTETLRGERKGSLLHALDRTVTSAGARMLSTWLTAPLTRDGEITARQDAIEAFLADKARRDDVRAHLKTTPDLSRALSRLGLGRGGPRDLAAIRQTLNNLPNLLADLNALEHQPSLLGIITESLQGFENLQALLDRAVAEEDLPLLARDGGFIKAGYDAELDKYRNLNNSSLETLQKLERAEAEALGVSSLKIKYNKVWGYFIEITKTHASKAPSHYIHRQTTTNQQRFTTPELIDLEKELSSAETRAQEKELTLFQELVEKVCAEATPLLKAAHGLATLDVLTAAADLAHQRKHVRPTMTDDRTFDVVKGRHPVVENTVETFMPNDCDLTGDALWLLTGPNMAGKSTFLRQNALIAIMAHAGLFVPAEKATIGVIDRVFTRVGAADDLARGQSTFMVEMVETATILNNASNRSLVILDEIGRGTATYDGLSIAWACVEYLSRNIKCRTLFATHYHELTQLADSTPNIHCYHVAVKEWEGEIVFMHQVKAGASPRSYGIHVGRLAGLPAVVTNRAETILHQLENKSGAPQQMPLFEVAHTASSNPATAATPEKPKPSAVDVLLGTINPDTLSPKQALDLIYELKDCQQDDNSQDQPNHAKPLHGTGTKRP